jgi:hypothetical protein
MGKMKAKVPPARPRPIRPAAQESAQQSDVRRCGGLPPARPGSAAERGIVVSRVRRFSPRWRGMVLAALAAAPLAPAVGQNLDAGKPASQIFAEVCANCHRSPREFRSNPGASFLREHYTTGSDMASTMAAYLSGSEQRGAAAPQPKRPPTNPAAPAATVTATPTRDPPAADLPRDPRRAQQAADPKAVPAPPNLTRGRPGSARAENTAEAKPAPGRPVLEDFEE